MSLLTALMLGFGGYGQGRQQRTQNQEEQQRIGQGQEYVDIAQQQQKSAQEQILRNRGIDPATGQPFQLPQADTQARPNNKGKGGPATDQETINMLYKQAHDYAQQGNEVAANIALSRASSLESMYKQQQNQIAILGREQTMADYRNQLPLNAWQQYNQGLNNQYGAPGMREPYGYGHFSPQQQWEDQYRTQHPPRGSSATPEQLNAARGQWYQDWAKLTKPGTSQLGIPTPAKISDKQAVAASHLFSMIDNAPNPTQKAQELAQGVQDPDIKQMLFRRAKMAEMAKPAPAQQLQPPQLSPGGSNDEGPPPSPYP